MSSHHEPKRFATAQALAAFNGITLHKLDGDGGLPIFITTRWAMTKQLDTLDEVDAWLLRVIGKKGEVV